MTLIFEPKHLEYPSVIPFYFLDSVKASFLKNELNFYNVDRL